MLVEVQRGTVLALHLGRLKDDGRLRPEHVSLWASSPTSTRRSTSPARRAACSARNGITLEYPVIRHMNNLESVVTYEGTAEIHTLVLGAAVTGQQAYR